MGLRIGVDDLIEDGSFTVDTSATTGWVDANYQNLIDQRPFSTSRPLTDSANSGNSNALTVLRLTATTTKYVGYIAIFGHNIGSKHTFHNKIYWVAGSASGTHTATDNNIIIINVNTTVTTGQQVKISLRRLDMSSNEPDIFLSVFKIGTWTYFDNISLPINVAVNEPQKVQTLLSDKNYLIGLSRTPEPMEIKLDFKNISYANILSLQSTVDYMQYNPFIIDFWTGQDSQSLPLYAFTNQDIKQPVKNSNHLYDLSITAKGSYR